MFVEEKTWLVAVTVVACIMAGVNTKSLSVMLAINTNQKQNELYDYN
jgi:hypothetical protein